MYTHFSASPPPSTSSSSSSSSEPSYPSEPFDSSEPVETLVGIQHAGVQFRLCLAVVFLISDVRAEIVAILAQDDRLPM